MAPVPVFYPSTMLTTYPSTHCTPKNPRVVCLLKKQYAASPEGAIFVVQSHVYSIRYTRGVNNILWRRKYTHTHTHTYTYIIYINYVFAINHSLCCGGPVAAAIVVGKVRPTPINQQKKKKTRPRHSVVRDPAVKQARMSSILQAMLLLVCMWRFNNNNNMCRYHHDSPSKTVVSR